MQRWRQSLDDTGIESSLRPEHRNRLVADSVQNRGKWQLPVQRQRLERDSERRKGLGRGVESSRINEEQWQYRRRRKLVGRLLWCLGYANDELRRRSEEHLQHSDLCYFGAERTRSGHTV